MSKMAAPVGSIAWLNGWHCIVNDVETTAGINDALELRVE